MDKDKKMSSPRDPSQLSATAPNADLPSFLNGISSLPDVSEETIAKDFAVIEDMKKNPSKYVLLVERTKKTLVTLIGLRRQQSD